MFVHNKNDDSALSIERFNAQKKLCVSLILFFMAENIEIWKRVSC